MRGVAIVLHAHIPYVLNHGVWPHGMEWLYEAAAESYIPILKVFEDLKTKGITPKITINITPVLMEQLSSSTFKDGFHSYINEKRESAIDDARTFSRQGYHDRVKIAKYWVKYYEDIAEYFDKIGMDIVGAYRKLHEQDDIEITTSAATHGYLPLISRDEFVYGQILQGRMTYERHFQTVPRGIWPPELAYRPEYNWRRPTDGKEFTRKGLEHFYSKLGYEYFIIDHHLLRGGKAIGTYLDLFPGLKELWGRFTQKRVLTVRDLSPNVPYLVGGDGNSEYVVVYTRDPKTAVQVWSRDTGYPGDPMYLEFHKRSFPSGHRYWRVTSREANLGEKGEYDPETTEGVVFRQATHFVSLLQSILNNSGVVVCPFDAELFGHWWHEGPSWLKKTIETVHYQKDLQTVTLKDYLSLKEPELVIELPEGSWGEGGFHWVWYNEWTKWTWEHIHSLEDEILELFKILKPLKGSQRLAKIMAREMLLLQSSDWQFLITTWSARDYAEHRVSRHVDDLKRLINISRGFIKSKKFSDEDMEFLNSIEKRDEIFPDIDPFQWIGGE